MAKSVIYAVFDGDETNYYATIKEAKAAAADIAWSTLRNVKVEVTRISVVDMPRRKLIVALLRRDGWALTEYPVTSYRGRLRGDEQQAAE